MSNILRILIATPLYPPDVGGPATYSRILSEELPKNNISTDILSFGTVRNLPKGISHITYFFRLFVRARKSDVLFALDPFSVGLPVCIVAFILKKPFILKVVGDYAWEQYMQKNIDFITPDEFQNKRFGLITELRRFSQRCVAKHACKIIVPSKYLKKIVEHWGVRTGNVEVIYNAVDISEIDAEKKELRALLGIEGQVIISAGRLVPWKGFSTLIELMPEILKKSPNTLLVIAGDGPELSKLQKISNKLELKDKVRFLGALPKDTLLRYIKAADIFVLNTGYEGFSHQLLEVMVVGIPIITTNIGGNPELIENGREGILLSYNNKAELGSTISEVLNGHTDTKLLVENAKKKVAAFNTKRMVKEIVTIFQNI